MRIRCLSPHRNDLACGFFLFSLAILYHIRIVSIEMPTSSPSTARRHYILIGSGGVFAKEKNISDHDESIDRID